MYGNVPAFQELSVDKISKFVSLGNMQSLFKQEFIDNSNRFTFAFCGDLPTDEILGVYRDILRTTYWRRQKHCKKKTA